jgi:hypothetical protein
VKKPNNANKYINGEVYRVLMYGGHKCMIKEIGAISGMEIMDEAHGKAI